MYSIELKSNVYKLTFSGQVAKDEMEKWVQDSQSKLAAAPDRFGVFVDMRELKPLPQDAQDAMKKGQVLYKQKGMVRSVVILKDTVTTMQFKRIARETGIDQWERYVDASTDSDWKNTGLNWVVKGVDPDAN